MDLRVPHGWQRQPVWMALTPTKRTGHVTEEVLSVYRDHGVIPKSSRSDNHNRTPENLDAYQLVEPGDVVFNKMKAWSGSVGVSEHRGIVSGDYLVCRTDGATVDRRFLHYLLRSRPFFEEYARRSTGIRPSQWRLYWEELSQLDLPLPNLDDQRRIANYLDCETGRMDRAVAASGKQLMRAEERLAAEAATLLHVDDGVPFTPFPGAAPRGYIPLWLAAKTFSGKTLQSEQAQESEQETPYLKASNIGYEEVELTGLDTMWASPTECAELRIREGDVFVIEGGATAGKAAHLLEEPDHLTILQNHVHCVRASDGFSQRYLYWVLRAYYGSGWYPVITSAVTFGSFPAMKLRALPVPNLDPHAQEATVATLDGHLTALHAVRERTESFRQLLNERKQALITAAVTGEITV
ncbi:hypothetical protein NHL50_09785 [Acidimicrobiia bacterium EGI L10123]|uniref:restriction endonuclease subunit S n=1 Tax=Salinilacustrithrix flava TaxID=2957203 RepID=UPI003D7C2031|nr:hypothetical protein [Acidimicrobiia bacterium EGI L10123]